MRHVSRQTQQKPRVLATDLDGTFIPLAENDQNRADLKTLQDWLAAHSVTLTFVTGRHLEIVEQAITQHELPQPEWIICDVGSSVYRETPDGWQTLAAYHDHLAAICEGLPMDQLRQELTDFERLAIQEEEKQGPFKLSYYVDQSILNDVSGRLTDWLSERDAPWSLISSVDPFTNNGLIDLLPRDVSKAHAVEWWREHCGYEREQIVFAGDSGNDLAALIAGYRAIVVGNADRELAARVREHHNNEGWTTRLHLAEAHATSGVLEGMRAFGLSDPRTLGIILGATPLEEGGTEFTVWAPDVQRVDVQIDRGDTPETHQLESIGDGYHRGVLSDVAPGERYAYRLDETIARPDPRSRFQPDGVHGPSEVIDPGRYEWRDNEWTGVTRADLIIYELHIGTFTEAGTYRAAIERIAELEDLGITAIEIMPLAQAAGQWNWGYDGVNLFAPCHSYGPPDDFRAFVEAAHEAGLAVLLDVVYNHVGPEGNYLSDFGPYFSTIHHTPWGEAFNFDGPDSAPVRKLIVDNARNWLEEYHLDGLRLDAVHCMIDESDDHILSELRREIADYATTVRRTIHLIAEANLFDEQLLRTTDEQIPYDAIWCDDIMHSFYSHFAPEVKHTQRPYEGAVDLAESLQRGYIYTGPPEARVEQNVPAGSHSAEAGGDLAALVIALQNHDVVGNDPHGRRVHQLTSIDAQKAAAALVLLYPAIPLLFMGEEFAADAPFRFFTDFQDEHLRQGVELGRAREYPQHQNADYISPLDSRAFTESKLGKNGDESMREWYRSLIQLRKDWQADGSLQAARLSVECQPEHGVFTLRYLHDTEPSRFVVTRIVAPEMQQTDVVVSVTGRVLLDSQQAQAQPQSIEGDITLRTAHALVGVGDFRLSQ